FGSVDITVENSKRLLEKSPNFDIILTAESEGIPLAYEMSRQSGKVYIVARKSANQTSAVNKRVKEFFLDADDTELIRDKRVLIVDDIVSTGESLKALNALVEKSSGITAAKVAVLAENNIAKRDRITFLEKLSV
ncbi:MAG: adenine phosphoribosyltransferase, partial [Ruminococcus sp.]|nr:adenine phosphoribosyltransferase [Ruminococcus sp.]